MKGATSGDTLDLDDVRINCEQNSLLFLVTPRRKGACHTKDANGVSRVSCYYRRVVDVPSGPCVPCGAPRSEHAAAVPGLKLVHADAAFAAPSTPMSGPSWPAAIAMAVAAAVLASAATVAVLRKR